MDLLSRREHAVAELRRKLVNKGFDEVFVDEALAKLVDDGYLAMRVTPRVMYAFG